MTGTPFPDRDSAFPPLHAGTLGRRPPAADLSVIFAVGASLFDDRFGLADRKPKALVKMPFLANDRLDPARSHGDVLLHHLRRHPGREPLRAAPADAAHPRRAVAAVDGRRVQPALQARAGQGAGPQPDGLPRRHREPRRRRRRR